MKTQLLFWATVLMFATSAAFAVDNGLALTEQLESRHPQLAVCHAAKHQTMQLANKLDATHFTVVLLEHYPAILKMKKRNANIPTFGHQGPGINRVGDHLNMCVVRSKKLQRVTLRSGFEQDLMEFEECECP